MNGVVYFARVGNFVKVGHTSQIRERLRRIRRDSSLNYPEGFDPSAPVDLLRVIDRCSPDDESAWHSALHAHHAAGEWFHDSPALREAIADEYEPDVARYAKWQRQQTVMAHVRQQARAAS